MRMLTPKKRKRMEKIEMTRSLTQPPELLFLSFIGISCIFPDCFFGLHSTFPG